MRSRNLPKFLDPFTGSSVLIIFFFITYFLPLIIWLFNVIVNQDKSFPESFSFWQLLFRTIWISITVAFLSVLGAYPLAIIWRLSKESIQKLVIMLMVIPLIMGLLARNYSWIGLLSSKRPLSSLGFSLINGSELLYTIPAIIIVMTCVFIPIAFFMIIQGLRTVIADHIYAGTTMGLNDKKVLFSIIIPLSYRSALLSFVFIFTLASGFFVTPSMLGGNKFNFISNAILTYVDLGLFGRASIIALAFLGIMAVPLLVIFVNILRIRKITMGK